MAQDTAKDKLTVQEAAQRLGIKDDAVRKRVQRGTMDSEKGQDGRVYVFLDAAQDEAQDTYQDDPGHASEDRGELVEFMRDEIAHLRSQLEEEREARRRADTIIAQLSQATAEQARTIRAIEPAQDAHQDAGEDLNGEEAPDSGAEAQNGTQSATNEESRPWWRRLFS